MRALNAYSLTLKWRLSKGLVDCIVDGVLESNASAVAGERKKERSCCRLVFVNGALEHQRVVLEVVVEVVAVVFDFHQNLTKNLSGGVVA